MPMFVGMRVAVGVLSFLMGMPVGRFMRVLMFCFAVRMSLFAAVGVCPVVVVVAVIVCVALVAMSMVVVEFLFACSHRLGTFFRMVMMLVPVVLVMIVPAAVAVLMRVVMSRLLVSRASVDVEFYTLDILALGAIEVQVKVP